jgi:hypothetical protein
MFTVNGQKVHVKFMSYILGSNVQDHLDRLRIDGTPIILVKSGWAAPLPRLKAQNPILLQEISSASVMATVVRDQPEGKGITRPTIDILPEDNDLLSIAHHVSSLGLSEALRITFNRGGNGYVQRGLPTGQTLLVDLSRERRQFYLCPTPNGV